MIYSNGGVWKYSYENGNPSNGKTEELVAAAKPLTDSDIFKGLKS